MIEEALSLVPGHTAALLALEESAIRGGDAALLQSVLDRRLAAAASAGERGRLLCRLALLAEANPERTADALDLWSRALDEEAGKGAAALARAGTRRVAARIGKDAALARAVELEAEAAAGPERAAWMGLGAALAKHRLGASARAVSLVEEARAADPNDPVLMYLSVSNHLEAGNWTKARLCLDHHAELSKDKDWGATLAGFGAHLAEHHEGDDEAAAARYRRLLEARPGDPVALVALERIASRTGDAPAQVGWPRRPSIAAATWASARRWRCAPPSWRRRRRTICRARRGWPGGRWRRCPATRPAAHVLERLYATLGQWGELVKVVEVGASAGAGERSPSGAPGGGARAARETSARFERVGALYEERLQDPGKALALYGEWAELGERRPAALRALLRAAEKAGDALVAAEAALKLGTEIPELPRRRALRLVLPRGGDLRRARRRRRGGGAGLRGRARARSRLAPGAGRTGPRALPGPAARGAGHRAVEAGGFRAEPRGAPARWPSRRPASTRSVSAAPKRRWRRPRARSPWILSNVAAIAEHARLLGRIGRGEELAEALGDPGAGARRSDRQGGGVPAAGGDRRMAAGRQARGAGRRRARGGRDERRTSCGRRRDPHRVAASLSAGRARRGAGGGGARPADRRPARPRRRAIAGSRLASRRSRGGLAGGARGPRRRAR